MRRIRMLEENYRDLTDSELKQEIRQLRIAGSNLGKESSRESAFAIAVEALVRIKQIRLYDSQLFASLALTTGSIAEMQTGEGKTLSVLPAAIYFALFGQGVHVATTNPYLAARDHQIVEPVLQMLGISCGLIQTGQHPTAAKQAYDCEITYGPGFQFGFDYLADQLTLRNHAEFKLGAKLLATFAGYSASAGLIQRRKAFCIIDEIDSVLLDEGTTPLLLAGSAGTANDKSAVKLAQTISESLNADIDFVVIGKRIKLTDIGFEQAHHQLQQFTQVKLASPWCEYVENALFANHELKRNVHYVVHEETIQIVDQNTGRILPDQTWKNGLHQAVEVKEGVAISDPTETKATISRQRLFAGYALISGLTGTADGHQQEFREFFDLPIITVPPNRPSQKKELPPRIFDSSLSKLDAVVADVAARQATGQPILIGTRTISESLRISEKLVENNIGHQVLNGIQNEKEARVISQAGTLGAVTVATNIAGRGTDIKVSQTALEAGGLHVILFEPHDSQRVDRQLIGRCGRQGEVGSHQLFASADDRLFELAPKLAAKIKSSASRTGESRLNFRNSIRKLQSLYEARSFEQRRKLKLQDSWQRRVLSNLYDPTSNGGGIS